MNIGFLISLVISLIITIFAYLFVPMIFVIRKSKLSKKKQKWVIVINGIVVFLLFSIYQIEFGDGSASAGACCLWSGVGYAILKKKCSGNAEVAKEQLVEDAVAEQPIIQSVVTPQPAQQTTSNFETNTVIPKSKKGNKGFVVAIVLLGALCLCLLIFNIIQFATIVPLKQAVSELTETNSEYEELLEKGVDDDIYTAIIYEDGKHYSYNYNAYANYDTYEDFYTKNRHKLNFYDENIVFVLEGYGNYYYTYDQVELITQGKSYSYWAYNKEAAISNGYKPF